MDWQSFKSGDLVWFDPNNSGFHIPGEIQEVHVAAQVLIVGAFIDGKVSITHIFRSCRRRRRGARHNGKLIYCNNRNTSHTKTYHLSCPSLFSFSTHLFGFLKN